MPDVIEQLRSYGEAVEHAVEPLHRAAPRDRRSLLLAAAALVVVAGVAGAVWVLRAGGDEAEPPVVSTAEEGLRRPEGWRSLDPGPLAPREQAAVVWTGEELVVWGGQDVGGVPGPAEDDGAAYDPDTETWRAMDPAPLAAGAATAAWTGDEVLVVSRVDGSTAAWEPATGDWRVLRRAPRTIDVTTVRSGAVPVWTGAELIDVSAGASYDPASDQWTDLPASPVDGVLADTTWTGTEVVAVYAQRNDLRPASMSTSAAAYDPDVDSWRLLPDAQLSIAKVAWDGERLIAVDCDERAATLDPAGDRWDPLPLVPVLQQEGCDATPVVLGGEVYVVAALGTFHLTDDRRWAVGTPAPNPVLDVVAADDQLMTWSSSGDEANLGPDHQFLQAWVPPAPRDDLALGDEIPAALVGVRLPDGARLTEIEEIEGFPDQGPPASTDSTFIPTIATADDGCQITMSHHDSAAAARSAASLGGPVEQVTIRTLSGDRHRATVGRSEGGGGSSAEVAFDLPGWQVIHIRCGRLATAEALFAGVSR